MSDTDNARNALGVGLFFVIGVALLVLLLSFFGEGNIFSSKQRAVTHFEGSLSGLSVGAPVTFRGVRVGRVEAIELRIDAEDASARIPVYISLNPKSAHWDGSTALDIDKLVERGLYAQLTSLSFVTGQLYIELDFGAPLTLGGTVRHEGEYPEIPSVPSDTAQLIDFVKELPMRELVDSLRNTLSRIDRMSATIEQRFEPMSENLAETLATLNAAIPQLSEDFSAMRDNIDHLSQRADITLHRIDQAADGIDTEFAALSAELQATAVALRATSDEVDSLLGSDAPSRRDIERLLRDLALSARALRDFSEAIEERPDRLIFGP